MNKLVVLHLGGSYTYCSSSAGLHRSKRDLALLVEEGVMESKSLEDTERAMGPPTRSTMEWFTGP